MYTNIDTKHALQVLEWFLNELKLEGRLNDDFNTKMIVEAATLIMKWNLFEYGNSFFLQLLGTAMGTPVAVIWATIYFYWHEKHVLIPKYGKKITLQLRYVDDIFAIAKMGGDDGLTSAEWNAFKKDLNNFGLLKWKVNEPSSIVNFLDITLKIENGKITSKTYQKPTNLYQYISRNSAHPSWMISGIIYSMLKRYYQQNTCRDDYWKVAMAFYNHLKYRGWNRRTLEKYFVASHNRLTGTTFKKTTNDHSLISNKETAILHFEYNKYDIPRKEMRKIWTDTCSLLEEEKKDGGLGIKRVICAYSRPRNLRDLLQSTKLHELSNHEVSTYF